MNSKEHEHTPSFELPKPPVPEQGQIAIVSEAQAALTVEQQGSGQAALPQAPPLPTIPAQTSGQAHDDTSAPTAVATADSPQIADDNDLIEKEWVLKAKEIVAQTAHDPHLQNKALNRFKADYLKKRYNKDIKLGEDE